MIRETFNISETTATLLRAIPIYPKEESLDGLSIKLGITARVLNTAIKSLPAYLPLAERKLNSKDIFCYPTQQAKNNVLQRIRRYGWHGSF